MIFSKQPTYLKLYKKGILSKRIEKLHHILSHCTLCPHNCGVNRLQGETGKCRAGAELRVSSAFAHFGEERELVGNYGSGTIFFSYCNLYCVFCQNYDISHLGQGQNISTSQLADLMISLQNKGCCNINFVTPTHFVPQIISALPFAIEKGLHLPLVYNCGGYESVETLKLLDGMIDIYMPDFKFADDKIAEKYTKASDYFSVVKKAIKEMQRQVGDLQIENGLAYRGLLIRHLILPNNLSGKDKVVSFIRENISKTAFINVMYQYHPCYKAFDYPELC